MRRAPRSRFKHVLQVRETIHGAVWVVAGLENPRFEHPILQPWGRSWGAAGVMDDDLSYSFEVRANILFCSSRFSALKCKKKSMVESQEKPAFNCANRLR